MMHLVRYCAGWGVRLRGTRGVPGRETIREVPGVRQAYENGDQARHPEDGAPSGGVDQRACQQGRAANAQGSPNAVHGNVIAHARATMARPTG